MPENDFNPKPIMFLNNPNAKQVVFFGQAVNIKDIRDSTLYHFYLWEDLSSFYNNIESYVGDLTFAETIEQAQNTEDLSPTKHNFSFESVVNALKLDDSKLKYILHALFEVCSSDKNIYIINSCSDANTTTNNLYLMLLIFRVIPKALISRLGFITYYKYIKTTEMNALNQNIKIRFVDNNQDNTKQEEGFILDINNFDKDVKSSSYLDFLVKGLKGKDTNKFNMFLESVIKDFSKINFNVVEQLYFYNNYNLVEEDFLNVICLNFNIFTDSFKTELISYITNKVTTYINNNDYIGLVLKIYNNIPELRDIIIGLVCKKIGTRTTESLEILSNEFVTKDFINNLNTTLYNSYKTASEFYFVQQLKTTSITKVLDSIIPYDPVFLKEINPNDFFNYYIKQNILTLKFNEFGNLINKLKKIEQKNMFTHVYVISANYYLNIIIDSMLKNNASSTEVLSKFLKISTDLNKHINIINNKTYINYFGGLIYELFIERNKNLDELNQKLDLVFDFIQSNTNTEVFIDIIKKNVALIFRNLNNDPTVQKLSTWKDEYISLTNNINLTNNVYCYKSINEFNNYIKNADYTCAKNVINTYYKENTVVFRELIDVLESWYENEFNKIPKDNFDYGLIAFLFYNTPEKIAHILPSDDITPLVEVMKVIDQNFRHLKIKNRFHKKILNNKKLLGQFLKLDRSTQKLFGNEMVNLAQKNKHFRMYSAFDFFGTSLGFCINIFVLYLITIGINILTHNKSYFVTGIFIIFGFLFSFLFIVRDSLKEDNKIKINIVMLTYLSILTCTVYLLTIDKPNKDNTMLNTCKKIFFVSYDLEKPVIDVIYNTLINPPTGETIVNTKAPDTITLNEDQKISLLVSPEDNNKITKFDITFDGEPLEPKDNAISLDMTKYSIGSHMLKLYALDDYSNETTTEINFVVNKIDKEIYTDLSYAVSQTDVFNVPVKLDDKAIITLEPKSNFKLDIKTKSVVPATIKIFIDDVLLSTDKENKSLVFKYADLAKENNITIDISSFYSNIKFNIKINK